MQQNSDTLAVVHKSRSNHTKECSAINASNFQLRKERGRSDRNKQFKKKTNGWCNGRIKTKSMSAWAVITGACGDASNSMHAPVRACPAGGISANLQS